ncbi:hypothetical protein C4D60_Mb01t27190 [Musa balbisiana]|uniref:Starch synthase catalytic domain-containing protein n=1 Tax=Musa balbisiana TaxID=52838 RepID=A0A4S8JR29_MUSBA|nr:hypothetical protein C4D60_Mb01t27190 [Musa balbisiana]
MAMVLVLLWSNTRRSHTSYNGSACMMMFLNAVYHGLLVGLVPTPLLGFSSHLMQIVERRELASSTKDSVGYSEKDGLLCRAAVEIVERRELASSTKDSVGTKEKEPDSYNQSTSSFSNLDGVNTTEAGIADEVKEPINGLEVEQSMADALGLLRETKLKQSHPNITLPALPDKSNSYVMEDENLKVSAVTTSKLWMSNKRSHSKKESWTLSPVANPNAMNVIVVAAECAPWAAVEVLSLALLWFLLVMMLYDFITINSAKINYSFLLFQVPWHIPRGGVCYGDGNLAFIANDWHTSLLPVYLKAYYREIGMMKYAPSLFVIQNIA